MTLADLSVFERPAEAFAPYAGHITPAAVLLMDGSLMSMARLHGAPYELESVRNRNGHADRLNSLLRNIGDDNVTLYTHLVRHSHVEPLPAGRFQSDYARELHGDYGRAVLDGMRVNEWFITVIVHPPGAGGLWQRARQVWKSATAGLRYPVLTIRETSLRQLEDITRTVLATLGDYDARRLAFRDEGDLRFTEIGEALYLIRTCRRKPIPLVSGSLGASIMTDRAVVEERSRRFRLVLPGETRWGACLGLREYMAKTTPGMLNDMLAARARKTEPDSNFDLVLAQSFRFLTKAQSLSQASRKSNQLFNAGDKATSQIEGLDDLQDDIASGRVSMGDHHLVLTVYADSPSELETITSRADLIIANAGANPAVEDRGLEAAFISMLPGTSDRRPRPGAITTRNFAHLSSLENFPAGAAAGYWGPPLVRFRSTGGTPYDFGPHVADVGHTRVFGRTGTGKTALLTFLEAMLEQATGNGRGTGIVFDKDAGGELLVLMSGGRYLKLRRGRSSGLAPLRALADTEANRSWLLNTLRGLIELDGRGPLRPDEETRLARGIARQMQMPAELRSLTGIREMLGFTDPDGAGYRFEKWCAGGAMGWLFDNAEDGIRQDGHLIGYDFTELLPSDENLSDDGAAEAAASYIMHRARDLMDGRRLWMFCDECRFYLPVLGRILEDVALTGRKKELMLWIAAQEPEHILNHPQGPSLLSQCRTAIAFPNANASRKGYVEGLRFTEAEFDKLTGEMTVGGGRRFLIKRESGSVICDYDLSALPEHLKVLSARIGTTRLAEELVGRVGRDPAVLWPAFRAAVAGPPAPKPHLLEAAE